MKQESFSSMVHQKYPRLRMSKKKAEEVKELSFHFVTKCPCKGTTTLEKTFSDYGYTYPFCYGTFLKELKKRLRITKDDNFNTDRKSISFEEAEKLLSSKMEKRILSLKTENGSVDGLFRHIRNSFAHSNWIRVPSGYYILWNESKKDYLNGLIFLRFEDLMMIWKAMVEVGRQYLDRKQK